MRGGDARSGELFSYVDLEARGRRDHPLSAPANCRSIGHWRIPEADLWDRGYPLPSVIGADNHGEIAFDAMQAGLDLSYGLIWCSSHGPASTTWTRSLAMPPLDCSTTARSKSPSPITTATKPSSEPNRWGDLGLARAKLRAAAAVEM